jgi:hypothetical protein
MHRDLGLISRTKEEKEKERKALASVIRLDPFLSNSLSLCDIALASPRHHVPHSAAKYSSLSRGDPTSWSSKELWTYDKYTMIPYIQIMVADLLKALSYWKDPTRKAADFCMSSIHFVYVPPYTKPNTTKVTAHKSMICLCPGSLQSGRRPSV